MWCTVRGGGVFSRVICEGLDSATAGSDTSKGEGTSYSIYLVKNHCSHQIYYRSVVINTSIE